VWGVYTDHAGNIRHGMEDGKEAQVKNDKFAREHLSSEKGVSQRGNRCAYCEDVISHDIEYRLNDKPYCSVSHLRDAFEFGKRWGENPEVVIREDEQLLLLL